MESTGSFGDEVSWDDVDQSAQPPVQSFTPKSTTAATDKSESKEPQAKPFLYIQMQVGEIEMIFSYHSKLLHSQFLWLFTDYYEG